MIRVNDILRGFNGPPPVDRGKFCKCTGPWDCQCDDVLNAFYELKDETKIWKDFDDLLWETIESGNGVDHQRFLELCKERFKISYK